MLSKLPEMLHVHGIIIEDKRKELWIYERPRLYHIGAEIEQTPGNGYEACSLVEAILLLEEMGYLGKDDE